MTDDIRIRPSARKHRVADADIRHAIDRSLYTADVEPGDPALRRVLYLGPDRAGNFLEVVAIARDDGSELVIHAMRMRRCFESLLPRPEDQQ